MVTIILLKTQWYEAFDGSKYKITKAFQEMYYEQCVFRKIYHLENSMNPPWFDFI